MKLRVITCLFGLIGLVASLNVVFEGDALAEEARLSRFGNGQAKERTQFIEGRRHGHTTRWYPDGSLRAEGNFERGKMVGEWIWNTPEGSRDRARSGLYENGERVSF